MVKGKRTLVKLLIILISFFCVDGGRSLLLVANNIQVLICQDHMKDIDVLRLDHPANFNQEEKWIGSFRFDFLYLSTRPVKYLYILEITSQKLPDSIWQPPEFV
jgi:hypothetical protein